MADTGNPWFIPFAEPSDLVRDWPALSSAVGTAVAAGLSAAANAGIGSNVVQAVKTNTFTSTSATFVTVTGLSVTITPSSETSKILLLGQVTYGTGNDQTYGSFRFSGGNSTNYVGGASGGRIKQSGAVRKAQVRLGGLAWASACT
jgi:hypothetical protein